MATTQGGFKCNWERSPEANPTATASEPPQCPDHLHGASHSLLPIGEDVGFLLHPLWGDVCLHACQPPAQQYLHWSWKASLQYIKFFIKNWFTPISESKMWQKLIENFLFQAVLPLPWIQYVVDQGRGFFPFPLLAEPSDICYGGHDGVGRSRPTNTWSPLGLLQGRLKGFYFE